MPLFLKVLIAIIALEHLGFLYLEMFLWNTPKGHKIFKTTPEVAANSKVLAANQGLYNGFLAAGLLWAVFYPQSEVAVQLALFFLTCVFVAGLYGYWTVSRTILYVQALPSLLTLFLVFLN